MQYQEDGATHDSVEQIQLTFNSLRRAKVINHRFKAIRPHLLDRRLQILQDHAPRQRRKPAPELPDLFAKRTAHVDEQHRVAVAVVEAGHKLLHGVKVEKVGPPGALGRHEGHEVAQALGPFEEVLHGRFALGSAKGGVGGIGRRLAIGGFGQKVGELDPGWEDEFVPVKGKGKLKGRWENMAIVRRMLGGTGIGNTT